MHHHSRALLTLLHVVASILAVFGQNQSPQFNRAPKVIRWSDLQGGSETSGVAQIDRPIQASEQEEAENTEKEDKRADEILARINARAGKRVPVPAAKHSREQSEKEADEERKQTEPQVEPPEEEEEERTQPPPTKKPHRKATLPTAAVQRSVETAASIPRIAPTAGAIDPALLSSIAGSSGLSPALLNSLAGNPGGLSNLPGLPNGIGALANSLPAGLGNLFQQRSPGFAGPLPGSAGSSPAVSSGLVNALSSLGSQLGRSLGLGNLLGTGGLSNVLAGGGRGPPVAGVPAVPGLPFPLPGQQFDVMSLVGGLSRRALNGSTLADVLPPDRIEQFADNLTDTLVPEMPDVDLGKFMGRWFEGINSPRATAQRCVVHHYGGLTENGKTATFTALKIYRDGNEFGQVQYSIGYAFRGGRQRSMLQMHSSESQDAIPFGKDAFGNAQYEYAVVSNWIRYPLMVLVRDPDNFKKSYEVDVLRWLEDHGFVNDFARTFNLIQPVDYSNCQYSDSTFAAFGK